MVPKGTKAEGGWSAADWLGVGVRELFFTLEVSLRLARHESDWAKQDERRMATFAQYALAAATEALEDARWMPEDEDAREATVRLPRVILAMKVAHMLGREFVWAPGLGV